MENSLTAIERLIQKLEIYIKSTIELLKYQAVQKTVTFFSYIAVRFVILLAVIFSLLFFNIGLAFWIGKMLGEIYLGFAAVALAYLCIAVFIFIFRERLISIPVSNFLIKKFRKENIL